MAIIKGFLEKISQYLEVRGRKDVHSILLVEIRVGHCDVRRVLSSEHFSLATQEG